MLVAANTLSSFGLGHHRQAAVPCAIDGANGEDHIILRQRQRGAGYISNRLDVFPFRAGGIAP